MERGHPRGNFHLGFDSSHLQLSTNRFFRVNGKQPQWPKQSGNATYAHDGKIGCNTVEYTMTFLCSDWLYFLWYGINEETNGEEAQLTSMSFRMTYFPKNDQNCQFIFGSFIFHIQRSQANHILPLDFSSISFIPCSLSKLRPSSFTIRLFQCNTEDNVA